MSVGRILAVGDVHGCHRALAALIAVLRLTSQDTVVFLGDVVDRGPDTKEVLDEIIALQSVCNVISITGNHEEMMRDAIAGKGLIAQWQNVGGQPTLDSYGGTLENVPHEHIRFLVSGAPFWESDHDIFVHASVESDTSLRNQTSDFLRWKHVGGSEDPHVSGKRVICGHTAQRDGIPLVFDGWACIDTLAHGGKWLSCLDVATDQVIQTSEAGEMREFSLDKYS